ncbi:hypothetical protein D3C71_2046190 [compost metagenome]
MAKHPAARFVEYEVAQGLVLGDPARLFPYRGAGWRCNAADDHVADFAFSMAADNVNHF